MGAPGHFLPEVLSKKGSVNGKRSPRGPPKGGPHPPGESWRDFLRVVPDWTSRMKWFLPDPISPFLTITFLSPQAGRQESPGEAEPRVGGKRTNSGSALSKPQS
jgi:hypothetical protein